MIINKKKKYELLINFIIFSCFFFYLISSLVFDRPHYSFITNFFIILICTFVFLKIAIYKYRIVNICSIFYSIIILFVFLSNLINGIFSYNFIILSFLACSTFSFFCTLDEKGRLIFIKIIVLGLLFGLILIFLYYLILKKSIHINDQFFMNQDRLGMISAIESVLCFFVAKEYISSSKYFFGFLYILASLFTAFVIISTERVGSLFLIFIFYVIYLGLFFHNKGKKHLFFYIFIVLFVFSVANYCIFSFEELSRIKLTILQFFDISKIKDQSIFQRVHILIRDMVYVFSFPLFGLGENGLLKNNYALPHNEFGNIGMHYGLAAMAVYIIFLAHHFKEILKNKDTNIHKNVNLFLSFYCFFDFFYGMAFTSRYFSIFIGLMFSYIQLGNSRRYYLFKNSCFNKHGLYYMEDNI